VKGKVVQSATLAKLAANFFRRRAFGPALQGFAVEEPPLTAAAFEARFRDLLDAHESATENTRCLACERCERCADSTFLRDCRNVSRSNYCVRCADCTGCSHTSDSIGCVGCSHCERCEGCTSSAYLVRCIGCTDCTYCFGCVGLTRKDFHVLNEPYDRQAYFAIVADLRRAMGI